MPSYLDLLLKLQVIDYDLGELERSKEYLPDMMDNLNREIGDVKSRLDETTSELAEARVRQKTLEIDIAAREAELQKFQQQMMAIKTNKEYDALVSQIDTVKGIISDAETDLLQTIERISDLEKDIVEVRDQSHHTNENNSRQLEILQEKIDSIGDKVSSKVAERKEIASKIPRPTLSVYERVRKGKGGTAVVAVKMRACGACLQALTPRKVQEIKKGDKILTCENCGRLLYWDVDESS